MNTQLTLPFNQLLLQTNMFREFFKKINLGLSSNTFQSSSSQNFRFPDLYNTSLILKIIFLVCGIIVAVSLFNAKSIQNWIDTQFSYSTIAVPATLAIVTVVISLRKFFPKMSNRIVELVIYISTVIFSNLVYYFVNQLEFLSQSFNDRNFIIFKVSIVSLTISSLVVLYLYFITMSLGPSNVEARLQSLTYRIRPHFLFNSLNAILALVRRDTRKAEYAIEELAELFRWLLKDTTQDVSLRQEIDIVQQFVSIEKIRMGERLNIVWDIDPSAQNAQIPSLTLQPLVENAIYHGAESMINACPITVVIKKDFGIVTIVVSNPYDPNYNRKKGSGTALDTIRQRLELYFDIEFKIVTEKKDNMYTTKLQFPFREKR